MAQIHFSNGVTVNFNGTPTQKDIEEASVHAMAAKPSTPSQNIQKTDENKSWFDDILQGAEKRSDEVGKIEGSNQGIFSKGLQIFGQGAGLGADIIGKSVSHAVDAIPGANQAIEGAKYIATETPLGGGIYGANQLWKKIPSGVKENVSSTLSATLQNLAKQHPEAAGNITALGNILNLGASIDMAGAGIEQAGKGIVGTGKMIGKVSPKVGGAIDTATKFGIAQTTGLSPSTIKNVISKPGVFSAEEMAKIDAGSLASKVKTALDKRLESLSETGKEYEGIKNLSNRVNVSENTILDILKSKGIYLEEGKVSKSALRDAFKNQKEAYNSSFSFFDEEMDNQYSKFKELYNKYKGTKTREAFESMDIESVKSALDGKVSPSEIDNIFYSQDKTYDEVMDSFLTMMNNEKNAIGMKFNADEMDTSISGGEKVTGSKIKMDLGSDIQLSNADAKGIEEILSLMRGKETLTAREVLNLRSRLGELAKYGEGKTNASKLVSREIRSAIDKVAKKELPGLADLDAKYGPEVSQLEKLKKDYLNKDGTLKDNAISKIANIGGKNKDLIAARLEKLVPGIKEEANILKSVEDIGAAEGHKVGTYTRALSTTKSTGAGASIGFAVAGPAGAAVGATIGMILTSPKVAVGILRAYGNLKNLSAPLVEGIVDKMIAGQKLTGESLKIMDEAVKSTSAKLEERIKKSGSQAIDKLKDIPVGMSIKDVSGELASKESSLTQKAVKLENKLKNSNLSSSIENTKKISKETLEGKREEFRLNKKENVSKYSNVLSGDEKIVPIYRVGNSEIKNGEYITIDINKANKYLKERGGKIFESSAKLKDLVYGNGLKDEFIYNPKNSTAKISSFSKNKNDEKNLLVVHNLNEKKLMFADRIGGLANPSTAVINPKLTSFEGYGDISLVGNRDLIRGEKTTLADAYSPRFPSVHSSIKYENFDKLQKDLEPFYKEIGGDARKIYRDDTDMIRNIENNPAVALKFLKEEGIKPSAEGQHYYHSQIINNNLDEKFQSFLDNIYKKYGVEEKMFAGYTPSGQRRYKPVTVEEASKIMSKEKGEFFDYGLGTYRSKVAPVKTSPEAVKKEAGRLVNKDDFEKIKDSHDKELWDIKNSLEKYAKNIDSNSFIESDRQMGTIGSVLQGEKDAWKYFKNKYPNAPENIVNNVIKFKEKLKKMPTEYFETKFKRPVSLSEFNIAVVPEKISKIAENVLERKGLKIIKYPEGKKGEIMKQLLKHPEAFGVAGLGVGLGAYQYNK